MKNQPKYYLGIDPGLHGALAIFDPLKRFPITVLDMPIHKATKTSKARVDVKGAAEIIERHKKTIKLAMVEDFWPGRFVNQAYMLGLALGNMLGILEGLAIPVRKARGCEWKKQFKLGADKNQSRAKAIELFPSHVDLFSRVKDEGRAEALLLAVYGHLRDAWEKSLL